MYCSDIKRSLKILFEMNRIISVTLGFYVTVVCSYADLTQIIQSMVCILTCHEIWFPKISDTIEDNVVKAADEVEAGNEQLRQASYYQVQFKVIPSF